MLAGVFQAESVLKIALLISSTVPIPDIFTYLGERLSSCFAHAE